MPNEVVGDCDQIGQRENTPHLAEHPSRRTHPDAIVRDDDVGGGNLAAVAEQPPRVRSSCGGRDGDVKRDHPFEARGERYTVESRGCRMAEEDLR